MVGLINVQHLYKGQNTSNKDAYLVLQIDDDRLEFLLKLRDWLDAWKIQSTFKDEEFLPQDIYLAFRHTLKVFIEVCVICLVKVSLLLFLLENFKPMIRKQIWTIQTNVWWKQVSFSSRSDGKRKKN